MAKLYKHPIQAFLLFSSILCSFPVSGQKTETDSLKKSARISSAQNFTGQPSLIPSSPQAASLGKYGDVPVSHYTGVPPISAPIYEIKSRDLTLPISVSYHGGGVRVEEEASQVGLGWALNAGGVIRRQIRGRDDLKSNGYTWKRLSQLAYAGNSALCFFLNQGDYSIFFANGGTEIESILQNMTTISGYEPIVDGELDIFTYNIGGMAGQFVIIPDGNGGFSAKSLKSDDIQISILGTQQSDWNFQLTLPNGVEYTFAFKERQKVIDPGLKQTMKIQDAAYDTSPYTGTPVEHIGAWYLTKIKSNMTLEEINFQYNSGAYVRQLPTGSENYEIAPGNAYTSHPTFRWSVSEVLSEEVTLEEINFTNGKVKFTRSGREDRPTGSVKLDQIEVLASNGSTVLKVSFQYDYFSSGSGSPSYVSKRLKLLSIKDITGGTGQPPYSFEYYGGSNLPDKNSYQQDYWGFYNGATGNDTKGTMIPSDQVIPSAQYKLPSALQGGANRTVDSEKVKANQLIKVTYPTGGSTTYNWESNLATNATRYSDQNPVILVTDYLGNSIEFKGPGLRIASIQNSDGNEKTTFEYLDPSTGIKTGKLMSGLAFIQWFTGSGLAYSSSSKHPFSSSPQGNLVGYSSVVSYKGSSRLSNGYTVFRFDNKVEQSNVSSFCLYSADGISCNQTFLESAGSFYCDPYSSPINNHISISEPSMPNVVYLPNGNQLEETYYNSDNRPVKSTINTYELADNSTIPSYRVKKYYRTLASSPQYYGLVYRIQTGWTKLKESKEITYEGNSDNPLSIVTEYVYHPTYKQLIKATKTDSKTGPNKVNVNGASLWDRQIETSYKYSFDFNDNSAVITMPQKNIIAIPIETAVAVVTTNGTSIISTPTSWKKISYNYDGSRFMPAKIESKIGTGSVYTETTYLNYDGRGNLLYFVNREGIPTWIDYYGVSDLGKTDLVKKITIGITSSLSRSEDWDYKPLVGLSSSRDYNGRMLFYLYDGFNRLSEIRENSTSGNLIKSFSYNYTNQTGQNYTGINVAPGVVAPSNPSLTGGSGCSAPTPSISASSTSYTSGGPAVSLSVNNCTGGSVSWNTNQTSNSISVTPSSPTTYTARCTVGSCYSEQSIYISTGSTSGGTSLVSGSCYRIKLKSAGTGNAYLQALSDNTVERRAASGANDQIWKVESVGTNQYKFTVQDNTSRVTTITSQGMGTRITLSPYSSSSLQAWSLQSNSSNDYRIYTSNGTTWDVDNYGNGVFLQLWGSTSEPEYTYRQFNFESVGCPGSSSGGNSVTCSGMTFTDGQLLGVANGRNVYVRVINGCLYITAGDAGPADAPMALDWLYILINNSGWASNVPHFTSATATSCFKQPGDTCSGTGTVSCPQPSISVNPTAINSGGQATLQTSSACSGGVIEWRIQGGGSIGQGASFSVSPTTSTSYVAVCKVGSCTSAASGAVTVTVNNTGGGNSVTCSGITFTDGQLLGTGNGRNIYVRVINGCLYITAGDAGPTDAPWALDWLYILINNGGWAANVTQFNSTVATSCFKQPTETCSGTTTCPAPTISASTTSINANDPVTLQTSSSCPGGTIEWRISGGNVVGSGTSLVVNPASSTSYVAVCKIGSCTSANSNTVNITVNSSGCTAQLPDYCWNQTIPANYFHFKSAPPTATIAGPYWSLSTGNPPFYGNAWYLQAGDPNSVIYPPGTNDINLPVNDYRIDVSSETTKTAKLYFNGVLKWSQQFSGSAQLHPTCWGELQSGTRVYFVVE
ncbi:Ig-like domain-containing protein [Siphonobacter aquaeclarae]|uniref:Ig-like domain-containing protein n=1 Tax=Siphonobacter aquaeclarae TaxID=563176 RepID=A0A1G9JTP5_9BACT|nr:RICIN domain-containing protein [Siphonobacter aquaeclarae]SDL40636.1 hypothetical protein SAMN04488090_0747 [Siphonobacter aquaeclarae]